MIRTNRLLLRKRRYDNLVVVLEQCRWLYNAALEQRILAYRRQGRTLSFFDQCKGLTDLRASDTAWRSLSAEFIRLTVLKRLHLAFQAFFRRVKAGQKPGFPRFCGKGRFDTLVFGTTGWKLKGNRLKLQGIGEFSVVGKQHRHGTIKGLRLKRVADRWEAQILVDIGPTPTVRPSTNGVGIDVGIRTFATLSDGERIEHPHFLKRSMEELRVARQKLSSKKQGSNRRARAKLTLSRLHRRIANRRQNFLHQTTKGLVGCYNGFAVEKLGIQEMTQQVPEGLEGSKGRGLHRGIMDSAWATFMFMLRYKAEEAGAAVVMVDPRGTSQRCSGCGSVVRKTLRERTHECPVCGLVMDRDLNAAVNIYDLGWRSTENLGARMTGDRAPVEDFGKTESAPTEAV
jgi:putative transposase